MEYRDEDVVVAVVVLVEVLVKEEEDDDGGEEAATELLALDRVDASTLQSTFFNTHFLYCFFSIDLHSSLIFLFSFFILVFSSLSFSDIICCFSCFSCSCCFSCFCC